MSKEKFRCHPSIVLEKTCGVIIALFFIFFRNLDDLEEMVKEGFSGENLLILGVIMGVLILILIYNIMVWAKTFIAIEENTIVIQRNTINSKENTFGIRNISNVNLEQNIFERIIGTYKIKIDTDSLSTANSTDIEIVLSKKHAYDFKNKVLSLMNNENLKNVQSGEDNISIDAIRSEIYFDDENIEYDIVYSVNDVLKHCFYNLSLFGFIFNLAMIVFAAFASIKFDGTKGFFALAIVLITSCFSIVQFFFGDLIKYYNFSIKREGDKLYISYGLLKIKKFAVPINRINALNVKQSYISRIFKRYQSDIVTIGVGDDDSEGSQILLSSNKEDFIKNMKVLLPELNLEEYLNLERESKNHHIIKIIDVILGTIFSSVILYCIYKFNTGISPLILVGIGFVIFLTLVLFYYMIYITRGLYMGNESMAMSWGVFAKKISIIKYEKVQYMDVKEGPISSKLGLCNGELHILASFGNNTRTLGYYNNSFFEKLKEKILFN
ncbi:PH domain-containing protein [Terrisporobacter petrolearius]|uniref:PH domain-containing protein n=1 Tax=Terrisporobacter petrolearius TaxID=1460447 RepID=UPI001D163D9D|nr:PH domain-containing protein [Terrisporobacter petrolearius]MCC3863558.1 PH domain-containing protein [Terrisporobacter petrolearius]